ncbi:MAG: FixH family protein [Hyphomicrobiaceae bacterium]|nr:FixH family protein [Hyphomicrobiaceae bacterium]
MSPTVLPARREQGLKGSHVLAAFLAFFGVIFLVNGSMIYKAIATNGGLVANEPYRKGLHYNERIAAFERQERLGWSDGVTLARSGALEVAIAGDDGKPVAGLAVRAVLGRPATNREDRQLALAEVAPGTYAVSAGELEAGAWLLSLQAFSGEAKGEPVYRARRRLWLKP